MAVVEVPRNGTTGVEVERFQIIPDLFDINQYVLLSYQSGREYHFCLVYKQPLITFGGGIYEFGDNKGYYSVTGADIADNMSGFRYKFVTYFGLGYAALSHFGFNQDQIRALLGVSSDTFVSTEFSANDLINLSKGKRPPNPDMCFCEIVFPWDAFEGLTPDDKLANYFPYTISLFENLYKMSEKQTRVNSAIYAAQIMKAQYNNYDNGIAGIRSISDTKTAIIVSKCNYITNEDKPNICQQPFEGMYLSSEWRATTIPGVSTGYTRCHNFCYLGVEAT